MNEDCKRLIEVDLPIRRISSHARREKDMRRGHVPLLHIYPAARPPAACRAVICAALWPDPADLLCPPAFRKAAADALEKFARASMNNRAVIEICDQGAGKRYWQFVRKGQGVTPEVLRTLLLDFVADYASPEASTNPVFLECARTLTAAAHLAISRDGSPRPLVVDSFAGGGAIPLEAARLGADTFASDMSPVSVLLNKVILEFIPTHGEALVSEVAEQIRWIGAEASTALKQLYPADPDGAVPTTYLWARTIRCEGPGCGATVPLVRSTQLVKKASRALHLRIVPLPKARQCEFALVRGVARGDAAQGTVRRGSATCPLCSYTTPVDSIRRQLAGRMGGAQDAQLLAVVTTRKRDSGRSYRLPTETDRTTAKLAADKWSSLLKQRNEDGLPPIPHEGISLNEIRRVSVPLYGMKSWGDLFTPRQAVALSTFTSLVRKAGENVSRERGHSFGKAVQACLALLLDKLVDMNASLCVWQSHAEIPAHVFGRWAIGMVFDFAETNPLAGSSGSPEASGKRLLDGLEALLAASLRLGHAEIADATQHPLPDDSAHAFVVDPPYYDAIPYAHLMDYFYVWLRRSMSGVLPELFRTEVIDKKSEIVVDRPHQLSTSKKDVAFYERELTRAFSDGRRILQANGVAVVVFASKTTASWEAILRAIVDAGWIISGSWPIDTEMESRVAAQGQARLNSSIHLVCRPRENPDGSVCADKVGDWRDVLAELPRRIHEWMPRLSEEGIAGADAIFACLGPALEIFSRYSRVEKASGEAVTLKEYLEQIWAAVAKEALSVIFTGADATGFEEDARLTAMWLWTINAGARSKTNDKPVDEEEAEDDDGVETKKAKTGGFALEYDAARKIAQGLGAHLEELETVVEVKGDTARLLSVGERAKSLFGQDGAAEEVVGGKRLDKKKEIDKGQMTLFSELEEAEEKGLWGERGAPAGGKTVLDRLHQAMILFAAGRGEAMRRFLVEEGAGKDGRFWRLAQAFSALYPAGSDEKRWVDGVLARKKGLGL